jgi:plastocyanin
MPARSILKPPVVAAALALLALGLAACGSSASTSSPAAPASAPSTTSANGGAGVSATGGGEQSIAANPSGQLAYTKKTLTAKAGTVKIAFTNKSPLSHNLTIEKGSNVLGATKTFDGGTQVLSVKLQPGTYTFFCSVPGHRMAGMVGTLTVK